MFHLFQTNTSFCFLLSLMLILFPFIIQILFDYLVIFKTHDMVHQKWRRPGYFLQMFVSLAQINWGWSWQREINQSGKVKQDLISHLTWCTKRQEQHVMLFEAAKDVLFQSYRSEPFSTYSAASASAWQVKTLHNVQSCFLVAAEKNQFPSNACAGELNIYINKSTARFSLLCLAGN